MDHRRRSDRGESLIELVVSIAMMGILITALTGAILVTVSSASTFKTAINPQNNVGLIINNWTDAINQQAYQVCATASSFPAPKLPAAPASPPAGYQPYSSSITVQYWDNRQDPATGLPKGWQTSLDTCPAKDQGALLLTLYVNAGSEKSVIQSEQTLKVVLRNPCNAQPANPVDPSDPLGLNQQAGCSG
ncbi:MAG: prepilin-type N-terminal cleavage/methylation domain-containing protein [Actinomycetes bacterium]